jgi:hypothetical protein
MTDTTPRFVPCPWCPALDADGIGTGCPECDGAGEVAAEVIVRVYLEESIVARRVLVTTVFAGGQRREEIMTPSKGRNYVRFHRPIQPIR